MLKSLHIFFIIHDIKYFFNENNQIILWILEIKFKERQINKILT
jgi:hypothetical protein